MAGLGGGGGGGGKGGGILVNGTEGGVGSVVLVTSIGRLPVFNGGTAMLGDVSLRLPFFASSI